MLTYKYRGRNLRGELVTGKQQARSETSLATQLINNGIVPVMIEEDRSEQNGNTLRALLRLERISTEDMLLFTRQMHAMLKAGIPIMRSLAALQQSSANPALAKVIQALRNGLDEGRELSQAMRQRPDVFSVFFVSLIQVGELTGRLDEIFLRLFRYLEFEHSTRRQISSALRYPSFVLVGVMIAIATINVFVIPAFAKVYKGFNAELPLLTKVLIGISDFTVEYGAAIGIAFVALVLGIGYYLKTQGGRYRWHKLKLRLPVVGEIVHKATMSRFARGLAITMKSGVPVLQGVGVVSRVVDNDYIALRIDQMRLGIERAESVTQAATTAGVFTPAVLQMIAIGEETGELDELLAEIADMYEREVDYGVATLGARIEPLMIMMLAGVVLVLALGVFLPIWDLGKVAMHGGQ
ncbi:Type II secretion system protein F [Andreprevotia sp. IGB-42]|uniref:type II secretion system F family protein n=1 Tax=Andreprevotia sp. IGB-42 TaxID=2497473 RepID=UPI00135B6A1D|nr:type II secretion system F family protein [Andreprevotia sp. IGB-42]KAF0812883.1 Type II secretion system protein F [Andreprevotia sp. IGB-42]